MYDILLKKGNKLKKKIKKIPIRKTRMGGVYQMNHLT